MPHQTQDALRRKLASSIETAKRHLPAHLPGLFVLTDPRRLPDPIAVAANLFQGTGMIYRHFGDPRRLETAHALARHAHANAFTLLIGNDPHLAQTVGAHGVHWPEAALEDAAPWQGQFKLMTCAAHSLDAMHNARRARMDAALVSTIFSSQSPSASSPIGPETFRSWCENAQIPAYALGGVTADNFEKFHDVAGAAMIGAAAPLAGKPRT